MLSRELREEKLRNACSGTVPAAATGAVRELKLKDSSVPTLSKRLESSCVVGLLSVGDVSIPEDVSLLWVCEAVLEDLLTKLKKSSCVVEASGSVDSATYSCGWRWRIWGTWTAASVHIRSIGELSKDVIFVDGKTSTREWTPARCGRRRKGIRKLGVLGVGVILRLVKLKVTRGRRDCCAFKDFKTQAAVSTDRKV